MQGGTRDCTEVRQVKMHVDSEGCTAKGCKRNARRDDNSMPAQHEKGTPHKQVGAHF